MIAPVSQVRPPSWLACYSFSARKRFPGTGAHRRPVVASARHGLSTSARRHSQHPFFTARYSVKGGRDGQRVEPDLPGQAAAGLGGTG